MKANNTFNKKEEKIEWGGWLNEFLWICAGANREVLRQCPTDYAKYAGIGGTILFTAIMASLSGGYALYKVFADEAYNPVLCFYETDYRAVFLAAVFGIIWGLMIFNLDRFMVNTMYSDGTQRITKEEFYGALPRLVLAVFIGIVISTPIELRIFKDKIQAQLLIDRGEATNKMDKSHQSLSDKITNLEAKKVENNKRIDKKMEERANIEDQAYKEATGKGLSGKAGIGNYTKQLERRARGLDTEVKTLQIEVNRANSAIDKQLATLYAEQNDYASDRNQAEKSMKGFAAELKALNNITNFLSKDADGNVRGDFALFVARSLIMLLFVAIEIIPTLFKLMMIDGAYDAFLKEKKHRCQVIAEKCISDLNDEVNTEVQISTQKNKERLEAEVLANKKLMERIAKTQAELLQTAIEKWREEELAKINENPSAYIKTNSAS